MPHKYITPNSALLEPVADAFGELADEVVFVGGIITYLLVDEAAGVFARKTRDVDVIANLVTQKAYYDFAERLRKKGFKEYDGGNPPVICRWAIVRHGVEYIVDVMPTNEHVLGFSNQWYSEAITHANRITLRTGLDINVISPVYFLATKFEAFKNRSGGDFYSHDMEDIVFILENAKRIALDALSAKEDVKTYLSAQMQTLLDAPEFHNTLPGLLNQEAAALTVINTMRLIARA